MARIKGIKTIEGSQRRGVVQTRKSHYAFNYYFLDGDGKEIQYNLDEFKYTGAKSRLSKKFNNWVAEIEEDFESKKLEQRPDSNKLKTRGTIFKNFIDSELYKTEALKDYENSTYSNTILMLRKLSRDNIAISKKHLVDISTTDCAKMLNKILSDTSVENARKYKYALQKVFEIAERLALCPKDTNPVKSWKATTKKQKKKRQDVKNVLNSEEEDMVWEQMEERLNYYQRTYFQFILLTGCRAGEAFAVEWSDIKWDDHLIYIHQTMTSEVESTTIEVKDYTKTGESEDAPRKIPLYQELEGLLLNFLRWQNEEFKKNNINREDFEHDFIFRKDDGSMYKKPYFTNVWWQFRESLMADNLLTKPTTLHNLRGTYISRCLNNKEIPPTIVQKLAGHEKLATTIDYYTAVDDIDIQALTLKHFTGM